MANSNSSLPITSRIVSEESHQGISVIVPKTMTEKIRLHLEIEEATELVDVISKSLEELNNICPKPSIENLFEFMAAYPGTVIQEFSVEEGLKNKYWTKTEDDTWIQASFESEEVKFNPLVTIEPEELYEKAPFHVVQWGDPFAEEEEEDLAEEEGEDLAEEDPELVQ